MSIDIKFLHRFEEGATPSSPTLLLLHGVGGNEDELIPVGRTIAQHAAFLSPRGRALEQGMPCFCRPVMKSASHGADMVHRTHELAEFLRDAQDRYAIDRTKVVALGFSNGANIAASLLLRAPDALAGAILIRSTLPFEARSIPNLKHKPILLLCGTHDATCPVRHPGRLASFFKQAGAKVTLHWEEAGHTLTQRDIVLAREWVDTHFPV